MTTDQTTAKTPGWVVPMLVGIAFLALFAVCPYATGYGHERKPIAYWLWYFWRFPEWQHGALVPFILTAVIWRMRKDLSSLPLDGNRLGLGVILFSLFLFFAGYRSNIYYLGYASCHLLAIGVVLWIGGVPWFKRLFFPIFFLAFLWPLYFLENRIGFPLRMLMTELSSGLLNGIGVEHLKQGTAIVSPDDGNSFALEVANPCSGIRSLFALLMIGALYGYIAMNRTWHWIVLCLSAIPFAIAGNVMRILILLGGSIWLGSDVAVGEDGGTSPFHFFAGIMVFLTASAGMFLLGKGLHIATGYFRKNPDSVEVPARKTKSAHG
ncbi:MAG: exosortase/archaeosortase family protein [Verrucomicrobiales bacterium]|nr:exosortase/archaeosortase family protein [Verrucomicrobiales bacterium]